MHNKLRRKVVNFQKAVHFCHEFINQIKMVRGSAGGGSYFNAMNCVGTPLNPRNHLPMPSYERLEAAEAARSPRQVEFVDENALALPENDNDDSIEEEIEDFTEETDGCQDDYTLSSDRDLAEREAEESLLIIDAGMEELRSPKY